jgi:integrase/recombinase XerD
MIEDMMVRKLAPTTQGSSTHAVKKFSPHFSRSPDCLALEEVHTYHVYLVLRGVGVTPK